MAILTPMMTFTPMAMFILMMCYNIMTMLNLRMCFFLFFFTAAVPMQAPLALRCNGAKGQGGGGG